MKRLQLITSKTIETREVLTSLWRKNRRVQSERIIRRRGSEKDCREKFSPTKGIADPLPENLLTIFRLHMKSLHRFCIAYRARRSFDGLINFKNKSLYIKKDNVSLHCLFDSIKLIHQTLPLQLWLLAHEYQDTSHHKPTSQRSEQVVSTPLAQRMALQEKLAQLFQRLDKCCSDCKVTAVHSQRKD